MSTTPNTLEAQDEEGALIAHPFASLRTVDGLSAVGWRSEAGLPPPKRVVLVDDTMKADLAYRLACEGTALLWRGDYQNAKLFLQALARRADQEKRKPRKPKEPLELSPTEIFNRYRLAKSQRARTLGMLLIPFDAGHSIPLRRAPDAQDACEAAYGPATEPYVASLRELLGIIGAYEWQKKGVEVAALGSRVYPHYGVFAPVRSEYVQLVADAPFPHHHPARTGVRHRHRHWRAGHRAGAPRRRPRDRHRARPAWLRLCSRQCHPASFAGQTDRRGGSRFVSPRAARR